MTHEARAVDRYNTAPSSRPLPSPELAAGRSSLAARFSTVPATEEDETAILTTSHAVGRQPWADETTSTAGRMFARAAAGDYVAKESTGACKNTLGSSSMQPAQALRASTIGTYGAVAHRQQEVYEVRDSNDAQGVVVRHCEFRGGMGGRPATDVTPSGNHAAHAVFLCVMAIGGAVYEVILKQKAVSFANMPGSHTVPFDSTSIIIWQSVLSIIIGLALCRCNRQTHLLCGPGSAWTVMRFVPVGCIFSFAAYLQYVILQYLPADVFKTLDQTRLLTVALMSYTMLGYRRTRLSWMLLVLTSFSVVMYSFVRALSESTTRHQELLQFARRASADEDLDRLGPALLPGDAHEQVATGHLHRLTDPKRLAKLLANKDLGPGLLRRLLYDDELAKAVHGQLAADGAPGIHESVHSDYLTGVFLTAVFVVLMCFASVYAERVLKEDRHVPFYVQKVYLEIPNLLFGIINAGLIAPWLSNHGIGQPPAQTFFENPFCGWNNRWVLLTFVISVVKSWVLGVLVKSLSALTKQLCGVVAVASTYFLQLVHGCGGPIAAAYSGNAFFCPEGLYRISAPVTLANFLVLASVSAYALEQRESEQPIDNGVVGPKSSFARV